MPATFRIDIDFRAQKLRRTVRSAERAMLHKFGSFARTSARQSIKRAPKKAKTRYGFQSTYKSGKKKGQSRFVRGQYSRPGSPPYSRDRRSKDIRYAVNQSRGYVVVGPVGYSSLGKRSSRKATNVTEFGGRTTITYGGFHVRRRDGSKRWIRRQRKQVTYQPRPFMFPAGKRAMTDVMKSVERDRIFLRAWMQS